MSEAPNPIPVRSKKARKKDKKDKAAERGPRDVEQSTPQTATPEVDFADCNYGRLPLHRSQERTDCTRITIASLRGAQVGQQVILRARVHTSRLQRNKAFFNFRQSTEFIQGLLIVTPNRVSNQMVKWSAAIAVETIVLVHGTIQKPVQEVKSATVGDLEILIEQLYVIAEPTLQPLPFTMDDASRPEGDYTKVDTQFNRVLLDTRLNNRVLDLRTATNQAIFKLKHGVLYLFQEFLNANGFTQIHSPKLQGAATESGASVFKVQYFKEEAFLAQSPQLSKQMAIAADFERVYEIGPVFRAEDSNTHRHLTEFTGLDLEMVIEEHYHEVMEILDSLFLHILRNLRDKYGKEIESVCKQFPAEEFKWKEDRTLTLTFAQAVDMLVEDGLPRDDLVDINTENEKRLGRLVKSKYDTDYFILDKFPLSLRPFYTMPDAENPKLSNSYDFFMRGEEVLSGAQRIHESGFLVQQMKCNNIDPGSMQGYVDAFAMGCPPHGGGGIGLERVVMLYLNLGNIRRASMFPRDPKRLSP